MPGTGKFGISPFFSHLALGGGIRNAMELSILEVDIA